MKLKDISWTHYKTKDVTHMWEVCTLQPKPNHLHTPPPLTITLTHQHTATQPWRTKDTSITRFWTRTTPPNLNSRDHDLSLTRTTLRYRHKQTTDRPWNFGITLSAGVSKACQPETPTPEHGWGLRRGRPTQRIRATEKLDQQHGKSTNNNR